MERKAQNKSRKSGVGKMLQSVRQERGLLIEEVALELKIRESQLEAVENEDWDTLPEQVYVLGFVRSYATFLEQDADALVQKVSSSYQDEKEMRPIPVSEEAEDIMPSGNLLWILAILALIGLGWWAYYVSLKPEVDKDLQMETSKSEVVVEERPVRDIAQIIQEQAEEVEDELPQEVLEAAAEVAEEVEELSQEKLVPVVLGPNGERVQFRVSDEVWFRIRDKGRRGKVLVNKIMKKGETFWMPHTNALADIGKPQVLDIYVDGHFLGTSSLRGGIIKGLSMNPDFLLNEYFGKDLHLPDPS